MSTTSFEFRNDFELRPRRTNTSSTEIEFENSITGPGTGSNEQWPPQTRKVVKSLLFRSPSVLSLNWSIEETTRHPQTPVYFVVVCPVNLMQPDVVLHAGSDRTGEVLGVSRFRFSRHMTLGFGDPDRDANSVVWEQMKNTSWWFWSLRYQFDLNVLPGGAADFSSELGPRRSGKRKRFMWEQTSDPKDGVDNWFGKLGWRNFKLIDVESDTMIAVFLGKHCSITETGELRIHQHVERDLEIAIVLTCASICRMINKRH